MTNLPAELQTILRSTPELEQAYLVGGCVRDWLLQRPTKDYDIEVYGLDYDVLAEALGRWGRVDQVGRSFGVLKLSLPSRLAYDFSIPRRDSKRSPGHRGFEVTFDATLTPREAAARRDFTINSLMFDPRREEVLDFFHGEEDLKNRILRHTSAAFPEDPLRVLRGMQLAGRFSLEAAPETIAIAQAIKNAYRELARERVREEWFKWAERSEKPSLGLRFLSQTGWIEHYPGLAAIRGVRQDAEWHPEGDVFEHTLHACDALAGLPAWKSADAESRIVYMLAVLTHDTGKALTTTEQLKRGRMRTVSPGHEQVSGKLAEDFLQSINSPRSIQDRVVPLVQHHMAHFGEVTERGVRRLAKRLEPENIEGLLAVMTADAFGRPPLPRLLPPQVSALEEKAEELAVKNRAPAPILLGRHLIRAGFAPGREIGDMLKSAYEAQLAGEIKDLGAALEWVKSRPKNLSDEKPQLVEDTRPAAPESEGS